jgi:hypothetical protein
MELSGIAKDIALLVAGIVFGVFPWLLDKVGIEIPRPVYVVIGYACILGMWWAFSTLDLLGHIPSLNNHNVSVSKLIVLCIAIGIFVLWTVKTMPRGAEHLIKTPTSVRLQFNEPQTFPVIVDQNNMFKTTYFSYHIGDATANRLLGTSWMVFLVFNKPIDVKEIVISGNGRPLPLHEVKDRTVRSAVIFFADDIVNTVVSIDVRN